MKTSTVAAMLTLAAQAAAQTTQTETAVEITAPAPPAISASLELKAADTGAAEADTSDSAMSTASVQSAQTTLDQPETTTTEAKMSAPAAALAANTQTSTGTVASEAETSAPIVSDTETSPTMPDAAAQQAATEPQEIVKITLPTSMHPPVVPDGGGTSVTLPTGTIYQVLRKGTGAEAGTSATRVIHYVLWLKNGTYVESSRDRELPTPFEFSPGSGEAIKGMEDGTNGMHIGEVRKLSIPANQAYGEEVHGDIPGNSDLIFVVELVDLKDPAKAAAEANAGAEKPGEE